MVCNPTPAPPTNKHTLSLEGTATRSGTRYDKYVEKKKTRKRLPRPLYRGNATRRGMLSKTQREKKKREETQNTTRKKKTKKKDLRTLFLYRGRKHDGTKGKVGATHHACHAFLLRIYRTSSSAF